MDMSNFIVVGENIHCTRMVKRGGKRCKELPGGGEGVFFDTAEGERILPVPANWAEFSPPFNDGKCRHIALAIYHARNSGGEEQELGEAYLCWAAEQQIAKGASFLDINVDEYTNDAQERVEIMAWLASFLAERYEAPLSIDSSNPETLTAGLEKCRTGTPAMINSVSLEREEAADVVVQFNAHAIVSAAGKVDLPCGIDDRLANFQAIIDILDGKGVAREKMHLDALVLPISVDPNNGKNFLAAAEQAKQRFTGVNLSGGLSNVSFGMPNRKLLNMVFCHLFAGVGGNGGIIDPVQMPVSGVADLDTAAAPYQLAKDVLEGTDQFGMEYIAASRDGRI